MPVTLLAFAGDRTASYYTADLPLEIAYRLSGYISLNLRWEWNLLPMLLRILVLILAGGFLVRLFLGLSRRLGALTEELRQRPRDYQVWEALRRNPGLLPVMIAAVGVLLTVGLVWWSISQPPPIPIDYLQENLFSLSGYLELFRLRRTLLHTMVNPLNGYYLYFICESIQAAACLSAMLLLAVRAWAGGRRKKEEAAIEKGTEGCKMQ